MRCRLATGVPGAVAALFLVFPLGAGAAPSERGFPLIQTYSPTEAETQSFGIARDPRGLLYVANLSGVVVYDGAWWRVIPVGRTREAFAVASDAGGRVAVGGVDDLGYLAADALGSLRFVSLLGLLPPDLRQLGQVTRVQPAGKGFAFTTRKLLLLWDGATPGKITVVATFPGDRPLVAIFPVRGEIYVWWRTGISLLAGGRLEPVPGGEAFRERVDLILPGPGDRGLLVSVRGKGLFLLAEGKSAPFAPEASRWTAEKRLLDGCRLADGRWALGSILGGLLLLRPDGAVDQVIDTSVGLPDDFVTGVAVDREGALWLSLNNGLARLEVASPLSVIDVRSGLKGTIYSVARHRGGLFVGTPAGVFTVAPATPEGTAPASPEWGRPVRMRPVPGLPPTGWALRSTGDGLLVGSAFGAYWVEEDGAEPREPRLIAGTEQRTTFVLQPSRVDPARVWLGMQDGLGAIRREGRGWRFEGMVPGLTHEVRTIVEGAGGVVWCGSQLDGVIAVTAGPGQGPAAARARRLGPDGGVSLYRVGGRILAATGEEVLRLDESRGTLVKDPALAPYGRDGVTHLAEDAAGNLWMNTFPVSVAPRRRGGAAGGWEWEREARPLVEVPARSIEVILAEADGVVWLGGEKGLYRYAGGRRGAGGAGGAGGETGADAALPAPHLSRLAIGGSGPGAAGGAGGLLFGGAPGAAPPKPELPPDVRRLRIEFAPLAFRAGLRYQTRLEPVDSGWSAPSPEPFAELTRLPPGGYTFRVRTVGPNREQGRETAWSFRVRPPWYETPWAFVLWIGAAIGGLRGYAGLRSRALHQRAARLESRVAEQTVELTKTVDELRHAQVELQSANSRLEELSLQDDLTGIANRRCLQQQLAEEWSRARRHRLPIGFILLDLDHFKLLNDTLGHPTGDQCLQQVARYLAATVRRTGDLVARYGGEEFAVLLPATDLAGALQVAEQLREGLESLALPAAGDRITASFGVAALVPAPDQRLEALVEAADLALYRAKTEGRNRVRAGAGGAANAATPPS
ncbi:MAG TPA: diguanylate cyclase [Thermoanaerobaculia bacterium]|nr:diguanylate cyclase [Thermoanaerobaculia bacterium]